MAQIFPEPAPTADIARTLKRFEFLATAAQMLAGSLDYEATLRSVAQLVIPELGDMCVVDVVEDGVPRRVAAVHRLPDKMQILRTLAERFPTTASSPTPAGRVLATGRAEILRDICEPVIDLYTVDDEHGDLVRCLGLRSHLAVPLIARGEVIGALGVGRTESATPYDTADVLLTEQLAAYAALAVENALHYRRAHAEIERRRETEERLARSERRFRSVIEQLPLAAQLLTADGQSTEQNRAWDRMWGDVSPAVPGDGTLTPHWVEAGAIASAFQGEAQALPARAHALIQAGRPVTRWISSHANPVVDEAGRVQDVVLLHQDETVASLATAALRHSEERLREALDAAHMHQWHWDFVSDRIECSDAAVDFWGQREAPAEAFVARVHPDDLPSLQAAVRATREGGVAYLSEYRVLREDGRVRWLRSRGRPQIDASGRVTQMAGVTIDITDRRQAEEHCRILALAGECLAQSLDYEATLANVAALVVPGIADWYAVDLLTAHDTLERVSVAHSDPAKVELAKELFARYPHRRDAPRGAWNVMRTGEAEWAAAMGPDWIRQTVHDERQRVIVEGLGLTSYVRVPLKTRGRTLGVMTVVHAESGRRYEAADVTLMMDLAGRIAMAVDNAQLYTRVQIQDRRKDEFLAMLAHELRNPLAPIATSARLIDMAAEDPARVRYAATVIQRQAQHMTALVDDLLDVSRVSRGELPLNPELFDLTQAITQAVEQARPQLEARHHALQTEGLERPACVVADRTRMIQVTANLLSNAARYTPDAGRITLRLAVQGGNVAVSVADTGIGISADFLPHVFELFSQQSRGVDRAHGGLGLGLALVHRLVELHGGSVAVASPGAGQGSTFTIRLPLAGTTQPNR